MSNQPSMNALAQEAQQLAVRVRSYGAAVSSPRTPPNVRQSIKARNQSDRARIIRLANAIIAMQQARIAIAKAKGGAK